MLEHIEAKLREMKCKKGRQLQMVYEALLRSKLMSNTLSPPAISPHMMAAGGPPLFQQSLDHSSAIFGPSPFSMSFGLGNGLPPPMPPVLPSTLPCTLHAVGNILGANATRNLVHELLDIDDLSEASVELRGLTAAAQGAVDPVVCLTKIGDEIVEKLVNWTKKLPFYAELPVNIHTKLLTEKWAEIVLLNVLFQLKRQRSAGRSLEENMNTLQERLSKIMGKPIPTSHLEHEVGQLLEKLTNLETTFRHINLTAETFVCVKAVTYLSQDEPSDAKLRQIQDRYMKALQIQMSQMSDDTARLTQLLTWLPTLHQVGKDLFDSKMFYVPFLLCKQY